MTKTIKQLRQEMGMTQQKLSDLSGVNLRKIQKVEAGEVTPGNMSARNILAIADALGVDPHSII